MTTKLVHYLNKTVFVSIPSLFGDEESRPFMLVGIEPFGLWLKGEALTEKLRSADKTHPSLSSLTAFFPISRIFYVVDPTQFAILARSPATQIALNEESQSSPPQDTDRGEPRDRNDEHEPTHKSAKRKK